MERTYHEETVAEARSLADRVARLFVQEVERLTKTGALPEDGYSRKAVMKAALQNMADYQLILKKDVPLYKNLTKF
jgi:hypothetical protein